MLKFGDEVKYVGSYFSLPDEYRIGFVTEVNETCYQVNFGGAYYTCYEHELKVVKRVELKNQPTTLPTDSNERKNIPLYSGPLKYFPAALMGVAKVCKVGNDKHNPGKPLQHSRGKSSDHEDCILRHLVDLSENGGRDENGIPQVDYIAWRALALAQVWHEKNDGAPIAPAAKEG